MLNRDIFFLIVQDPIVKRLLLVTPVTDSRICRICALKIGMEYF